MKLNIKRFLLAAFAVSVVASSAAVPAFAATNLSLKNAVNAAKGQDQADCLIDDGTCGTPVFQTITNVLLFAIGAVSVIMLIIGGFRYTVSQGDSNALTSAKNTILYSIIGIVVAILAYAAVNFVVGSFVD